MNARLTILGAVAALLFVIGAVLAIAKPGNLGDDTNETAAGTTTTSSSPSSTSVTATTAPASTTSSSFDTGVATTETTSGGGGPSTTATTSTGGPGDASTTTSTTSTTAPNGSGLGTGGNGSVDDGSLSDTGGPEWLLPVSGLLLALGIASRRLALRS